MARLNLLVFVLLLQTAAHAEAPYRSERQVEMWTFWPGLVRFSLAADLEVLTESPPAFSPANYPVFREAVPTEVEVRGGASLKGLRLQPYPGRSDWAFLTPILVPGNGKRLSYQLQFEVPSVPFLHHQGLHRRLLSLTQQAPPGGGETVLMIAVPADSKELRAYDFEPSERRTAQGWTIYYYDLTARGRVTVHLELELSDTRVPPPSLKQALEVRGRPESTRKVHTAKNSAE